MMNLAPHLNYAPEKIEHIHIMGICGTGMAALAGMLRDSGYTITGSDSQVYPPMSTYLNTLQIPVNNGYGAENLIPAPDLVIVGNVITRKNPEAIALSGLDIPYLSFPQALSHFFIQSRSSLVIAGTHGKTTTCSLLASSLFHAELDPTFMIGGIVNEFSANFRLGKGDYFVAEGDEYDTAFFDKESKFLHYRPQIAVITSIEFDHADIFENLDAIKSAFRKFVALIPENGVLIANFDDQNVVEIASNAKCKVLSYGLKHRYNWSFKTGRTADGKTDFEVTKDGTPWGPISVAMTGTHNCLNTLAVCAIMDTLGVSRDAMVKGLDCFKGVKRRQEVRGIIGGITVIDDFAHHPTAVKETLSALKMGYPGRRLIAVFEPRTNSSRRAIFQKDYVDSFAASDLALIREPIPIIGLEDDIFSSATLAKDINERLHIDALSFKNTDEILNHLKTALKEGDVVAILSNGGFDNIHERLLNQLRESESRISHDFLI
ncbi:MAG: UDP-N-acetylmuramate: L-alanyl-gamma-D-glutamyl-meso-diaminopimelate ligase [Desulforhopalus sp.]|jgi:UDP-N-acetylmuramate: L-alanyl-gamma-D-glutamyl-meso-diaminopimelate ligase